MTNKARDPQKFIAKAEGSLRALPHWLRKRGVNTYSYSDEEVINVGYDGDPDNEWSKKYQYRGSIIIVPPMTFSEVEGTIRRFLGWSEVTA